MRTVFPVRYLLTASLVAGSLFLSGCSMDTPTGATSEKIRLSKEMHDQTLPTATLDADAFNAFGEQYGHYGHGPVEVVVTYDPASRVNTAMQAANQASRIASGLNARKIPVAEVEILPVREQGDTSLTLIRYQQVHAHEPEGCFAMGGVDGMPTMPVEEYPFGCTVEMQIARQIANPKDLAGREGMGVADGRPNANIVEIYKTGAELPPLRAISIAD